MVEPLFLIFLIGIYGLFSSKKHHELLMALQMCGISSVISIAILNPNLELLSLVFLGVESCIFVFFASILFIMKRKGVGVD